MILDYKRSLFVYKNDIQFKNFFGVLHLLDITIRTIYNELCYVINGLYTSSSIIWIIILKKTTTFVNCFNCFTSIYSPVNLNIVYPADGL